MGKIRVTLVVLFVLLGFNNVFAQLTAGTYYFYNEGAEMYLNYGGNDDYTACFKPHGEPLILAGTDGQFTIQTALDSRYLSATATTENARQSSGTTFTFTKQDDGSYTISSSEGYMGYGGSKAERLSQTLVQMNLAEGNSPDAKWRLFTKDELLARFESASETNPVDATFLVTCPNFDRHHANLSAWSDYTTGNNTGYLCNNAGYKFDSGTVVQQTLSSIPNGIYLLKAQAFYRHGSNGTATGYTEETMPLQGVMFAGSNEVLVKSILSSENRTSTNIYADAGHSGGGREFGGGYIPYGASNNYADACIAFDNGLFGDNEVQAVVTDGSLTIGFKINELTQYSWIAYDNIELFYLGALQDLTPFKDQYYALRSLIKENIIDQTDVYTDEAGAATAYGSERDAQDAIVEAATSQPEISDAMTALWDAALTFLKTVTINDNKYFDFTWMIKNADFSNSSYKNFWNESGVSGGTVGVTNGVMRYMNTSFELSQKLAYILPAGQYKLNAGGFERTNNPLASAWTDFQAGNSNVTGAIFLNASEQLVKNLFDAQTVTDNSLGGVQPEGAEFYIPDGSGAANKYIAAGYYPNTLTAMLASDAEITLGYRCTNSSEWTCIDNFQLYYFGQLDLSGYEAELAAAVNEANQLVIPTYQKELLDDVIANYNKTYASIEDYQNAVNAIRDAKAAAEPFVAPYAEYKALKELVNDKFISQTDIYTDDAGAGEAYNEAVAATNDNVENAKAVADIEAENMVVWDAALTFLKTVTINDDKYFDLTWMIKDPDFSDTNYTKYWTESLQTTTTKGITSGLLRYYNCSFDLSQTLPYKLPAGTYSLKLDGFERTNDPMDTAYSDYAAGNSNVTGTIYFNNSEQLIKNLFDVQSITDNSLGGVQPSGASFYTPNGSGSSAQYLAAGLFQNTLNARLTADSEVTIGYRCANTKAWTCFDNFQLFYRGVVTNQVKLSTYEEIASQALDRTDFDAALAEAQSRFASAASDEEKEAVNAYMRDALCKLLKEQTTATGKFDITSLIGNADFSDGSEGWDVENARLTTTSLGVAHLNGTKNAATVSQTLDKLPAGHYTFMAQGFYRPTDVTTTVAEYEKGNENILADLFVGDADKSIASIFDGSRFDASSGSYALINGAAIPNSISNATETFAKGEYWNVMDADIATEGPLQLGVKVKQNSLDNNWTVFGKFHLYYGEETANYITYEGFETCDVPTPANITFNHTFTAGKLAPICVPFEVTDEQFEEVYAIGSIDGTTTLNSTAIIYPVKSVKPGQPCVVKPKESVQTMVFNNVVLSPISPDTYILPWSPIRVKAIASNANAIWNFTGLQGSSKYATTLKFQPIDIMDADYLVNIESLRAAMFLNNTTYTESSSSVVASYNATPPVRRDIPNPASVVVPENDANQVKVVFSLNEDLSDATEQGVANSGLCYIPNLVPQKMYYYKVEADGNVISKGRFFTDGRTRMIYAPTAYNIRDFGGWRTIDGKRTNYGHIFRGSTVNGYAPTTPEDLQRLRDVGVGAEIDLRYREDYDKDMGCGTSAFGFTKAGGDYYFAAANDYTAANISESGTQARWKQEFEFIVNNFRKGKGVYFHCAWGADRTGLLALLLEGLLGYEMDAIYKDYELTSFSAAPGASNRVKSAFQDRITVFQNMTGANLKEKVENFFLNTLGVSQEDIDFFRSVMLGDDNMVVSENKNFSNAKAVTANVNLIRTISSEDINPLIVPFNMTQEEVEEHFGQGSKVYVVSSCSDNNVVLDPQEGIEANKPVLLKATESGNYYLINGRNVPKTTSATYKSTADGVTLTGVYNDNAYVSANGYKISGEVANIVEQANTEMLRATFAFITLANEAGETLTFSFSDDATGIISVENGAVNLLDGKVYDLSGRQVTHLSRGVYIVNGHKVLIK